ncbi:hypothetical protein BT63DRAFT_264591 [Microthyrium microscopicum]|uniref:Mnd1 HTH domain-containing protein n=1 Tax=Microthyrium microscopicum TaxID=703497 RepID=A0A6A6UER8_9PEZI|nr:hypothetical protein BT63DRAFT_264591 [Microthyrium microscopicum]
MLNWLRASNTCHTLKDLEKALPAIAGIHAMQLKEHIQALIDDSELRVEKIGSGNWYWTFASDVATMRGAALHAAQSEYDKVVLSVQETEAAVQAKMSEREGDGDDEEGKKVLAQQNAELMKEVAALKSEMARYAEHDPVELERQREMAVDMRVQAEALTEQIECMAGWLKKKGGMDRYMFQDMQRNWYGDEWDEEEQCLREL